MMIIVIVSGDPVVNFSILPLLYSDTFTQLVRWYGVPLRTIHGPSSIDPCHHGSPVVCPWQYATTCVATHSKAPKSHFSTRQCSALHGKGVTKLSPHCYYPSLACPIPRFVSNRAYLGSFGMASWASHEFERTRGKDTANMELNVSRYHTEHVCLNARSYLIVHSC
ncbi:transposable element Tcb1 transposase [Trichonephila clavipes]|nr:transposable element Tcb1 transposase [Trichonephila clavipes]